MNRLKEQLLANSTPEELDVCKKALILKLKTEGRTFDFMQTITFSSGYTCKPLHLFFAEDDSKMISKVASALYPALPLVYIFGMRDQDFKALTGLDDKTDLNSVPVITHLFAYNFAQRSKDTIASANSSPATTPAAMFSPKSGAHQSKNKVNAVTSSMPGYIAPTVSSKARERSKFTLN